MDEPLAGLDPATAREVRAAIAALQVGVSGAEYMGHVLRCIAALTRTAVAALLCAPCPGLVCLDAARKGARYSSSHTR